VVGWFDGQIPLVPELDKSCRKLFKLQLVPAVLGDLRLAFHEEFAAPRLLLQGIRGALTQDRQLSATATSIL
jgi:hypothetical protein